MPNAHREDPLKNDADDTTGQPAPSPEGFDALSKKKMNSLDLSIMFDLPTPPRATDAPNVFESLLWMSKKENYFEKLIPTPGSMGVPPNPFMEPPDDITALQAATSSLVDKSPYARGSDTLVYEPPSLFFSPKQRVRPIQREETPSPVIAKTPQRIPCMEVRRGKICACIECINVLEPRHGRTPFCCMECNIRHVQLQHGDVSPNKTLVATKHRLITDVKQMMSQFRSEEEVIEFLRTWH